MITLYQELAEYLKRDLVLVTEYCKVAPVVLAWKWEKEKEDPIRYYRESTDYICDLTMYQSIMRDNGFHKWYENVLKDFQVKTILDFGGGIGEYTILAYKNGINVDFLEIEDSETLKYAKHRFSKYNISPKILIEKDSIEDYDLIVAMDVFEHIENNTTIIKNVAEHCKYMICNMPGEMPYNVIYPQHISNVFLDPYFEQITGRLWKSKLKNI